MSTTITLRNSINFVGPILKMQPLGVTGWEPAMTAANIVLQTILQAPFRWRWNRGTFTFETVVTTPPTTDYSVAIADFGFLEETWLTDPTGKVYQLNGDVSLAVDSTATRPTKIAAQFDDNAGNITFRVANPPDKVYTVGGNYQRKPGLITSPASVWGDVPDEFGFVYNLGFLTLVSLLINDSRFPIFEKWFIGRLLGLQDGLDDQARDIFLGQWMQTTRTAQRSQGATQGGMAGRSQ